MNTALIASVVGAYLELTMQDDPIVEEMRKNGQAFMARHSHDLAAILKALKEKEQSLGHKVVQRSPRYLPGRVAVDKAL